MMRLAFAAVMVALLAGLAGCGSAPRQRAEDIPYATQKATPATPGRGGYYKDDGPGADAPDIDKIPDAEPRQDPLHRFANNPYTALGRAYTPMRSLSPFKERGLASWYGRMFHGQKTSSGEIYDMYGMTAAHPVLPIPSYAKVTNLRNNRSVVVRINDRGPFHTGRIIDLSFTAAAKLGYIDTGSTSVEVELIQPADFARYARRTAPAVVDSGREPSLPRTVTAAEPVAESGTIYLQIGSFATRENADALKARVALEVASLSASVDVRQVEEAFKVQVGPYRNRAEAAPAVETIRQVLQLMPVFVSR